MRSLAATTLPYPGRERRTGPSVRPRPGWISWVAAAALHAAALAVFLAVARPGGRLEPRGTVRLWPPPAASVPAPLAMPDLAAPGIVLVPVPALRAPVRDGVPVPGPVLVRPVPTLRPGAGAGDLVRGYREGGAPPDTAAATEEELRAEALVEATRLWNREFRALIPLAREEMFLEALANSPFPRR